MLTVQVSPSRGLPGSFWTLLTHVESLTSGFHGEEGFWRPAISSPSPHRSTHCPPHEQLLVGLGAVGVSSISVGGHGGALVLIFSVVAGFGRVWAHSFDREEGACMAGIGCASSHIVIVYH